MTQDSPTAVQELASGDIPIGHTGHLGPGSHSGAGLGQLLVLPAPFITDQEVPVREPVFGFQRVRPPP